MSVSSVAGSVTELNETESRQLFDRRAQQELGVSGQEFVDRFEAGEIPPEWPLDAVSRLEILLPFAR